MNSPVVRRSFAVLILVATVDVITVAALLSRNQRLTEVWQQASVERQAWSEQMQNVSRLRDLARDMVGGEQTPGTANFFEEKARLEGAAATFDEWVAVVRAELSSVGTTHRSAIEMDIQAASDHAHALAGERAGMLELVQGGQFEQAVREMARAERTLDTLQGHLSDIEATLGTAQAELRSGHDEAAAMVRRAEVMIAGINLLLVVAGVLYARSVSRATDHEATSTVIFGTESVPVAPSERSQPRAPSPAPRVTEPPSPIPHSPGGDDAPATLEDFPSELEQSAQRRAS